MVAARITFVKRIALRVQRRSAVRRGAGDGQVRWGVLCCEWASSPSLALPLG
jgi:hypothetical protein